MKTVGELKQFLANLPDDMPMVIHRSNMERYGYVQEVSPYVATTVEKTETAVDAFDYTVYPYTRFVLDANGKPTLLF